MGLNGLNNNILSWGIRKGITGPEGQGTIAKQFGKCVEEINETGLAIDANDTEEVKDGIGDSVVALTLLAEMYGFTLEECVTHAYNIINKRTGKMVDGVFVKDGNT